MVPQVATGNSLLIAAESSSLYYSDVIVSAMASQITGVSIVSQQFVQVQIEENIKAPRHWLLFIFIKPYVDFVFNINTEWVNKCGKC